MSLQFFQDSEINNNPAANRAFFYGDAVWVSFYIHNGRLIMAEDCYFFLMASMRKMRMNIPLSYTLEFFQDLFEEKILSNGISCGRIRFMVYRKQQHPLQKAEVNYYFELQSEADPLQLNAEVELDLIKELTVSNNLLSNLQVHSPENIYGEIYASENDLDDVIFLNSSKRIARSIHGNLLLLEGDTIRVPKQTEGAYISPLMESFVTHLHKSKSARIEEAEIIAFETQKAEEILIFSEAKGISPVRKIRNKEFGHSRFAAMIDSWRETFS
ncbi:MAG: aminodeoxychorismate lyase [Chryseobacterium sp.]|nr:MAG: aminodeoxychorismate lyase [Chryseobacterium sp.]